MDRPSRFLCADAQPPSRFGIFYRGLASGPVEDHDLSPASHAGEQMGRPHSHHVWQGERHHVSSEFAGEVGSPELLFVNLL